MFAQVSTESEDDDGVDSQNVSHVSLEHKVLNSKPACKKKLGSETVLNIHQNCQKQTVSVTNHTITSKSRMQRETVAAFVEDMKFISSTTVKLRSVAIVVHVA